MEHLSASAARRRLRFLHAILNGRLTQLTSLSRGRSTLFTAVARRSAHLVQFGSFVFKQPKWRPYQQAPFFMLVTLVAITFISDPHCAKLFHKAA